MACIGCSQRVMLCYWVDGGKAEPICPTAVVQL